MIYLRHVNQVGRAYTTTDDTIGLSSDEYVQLWHQGVEHILNYNVRGERLVERKTMNLMGNLTSLNWAYMCLRRPCGLGLHQVVIDHNGGIFACDQARSNSVFCLGNIRTHTYDECYTSPEAMALRTMTSELYPDCSGCALSAFCGYCVCRGVRQHENPQPNMTTDFECGIFRRMIPEVIRLLMDPARAAIMTRWTDMV